MLPAGNFPHPGIDCSITPHAFRQLFCERFRLSTTVFGMNEKRPTKRTVAGKKQAVGEGMASWKCGACRGFACQEVRVGAFSVHLQVGETFEHLHGVQVELHVQGLAGAADAVEATSLRELPVIELAAQSGPGVLSLPQQHPRESLPHA
jgi:hypothetical protein